MKNVSKLYVVLSLVLCIIFGYTPASFAMHIMEGYLPVGHCIAWGVVSAPFIVLGMKNIGKLARENRKVMLILAMAGAYAFVMSALKIPSVTGSSSHPTGTGLAAMLFGPTVTSVIALIVLLFQAILLAHGGLTTLGANTFSMGIVGPIVSFGIYRLGTKGKLNRSLTIFLAASLGNLCTYVVTAVQLAIAHPAEVGGFMTSLTSFLGIFAVTQIPLAIIEGLLTVAIIIGLESMAKSELRSLGFVEVLK